MSAILVVAHAPLASSLAAVAEHVYPDCSRRLSALDVEPGASGEQVLESIRKALAALGPGEVLVMVDVFGATPCNEAARAADGVRVRVVTGVNVPMLWRTLCYADLPLAQLVDRALEGACKGVLHVPPEQPLQNQAGAGPEMHDQVQHRHQQ